LLKRGFTVIELLVALALLSVVLLFVFSTFSYQHSTYTVVDSVSEAQQNSRAIARLIERDIRNAGYLVPLGAAACGVDNNNAPDELYLSDADAILPADQLAVEYASKELGGRTNNKPTTANSSLTVTVDNAVVDGNPSYDTDGTAGNDNDFRVNGGAILTDRGNPERGVSCGIVTAVTATTVTATFSNLLGTGGSAAQDLVLVPANVYRIVSNAGAPPRLTRNGVLLAKDVEDLQVSYLYDDGDDVVESGERQADGTTAYAKATTDGRTLREIRMNLVMRTRVNDPRNPTNFSIGQALENHTTSLPAADGRHRRVYVASVRLRNLSL
jgi:prepilin-type N-terminal cleavage/methylation domain-containing protein